jgi:hypothetical protein
MATRASRIALAGSNISSTGEVDADLLDNTDSAAFLSLDSGGRLGIGATPSSHAKLHVAGGPYAFLALHATNSGGRQYEIFSNAADESFHLYDRTADLYRLTVDETGNVGIGTNTNLGNSSWNAGSRFLTIDGTAGDAYGVLSLRGDISNTGTSRHFQIGAGDGNLYLAYDGNNGAHRLVVFPDGDIGMGQGADSAHNGNYGTNLHLKSLTTSGTSLKLTDATSGHGTTVGFEFIATNGHGYIWQRNAGKVEIGTSNLPRFQVDYKGTLGIGNIGNSAVIPKTNWGSVFGARSQWDTQGVIAATDGSMQFGLNWYYDDSVYKRLGSGKASRYVHVNDYAAWEMSNTSAAADSNITDFATKLKITADGRLQINDYTVSAGAAISAKSAIASNGPMVLASQNYATTFGVLPWSSGVTYLSSGTHYSGTVWKADGANTGASMLKFGGEQGLTVFFGDGTADSRYGTYATDKQVISKYGLVVNNKQSYNSGYGASTAGIQTSSTSWITLPWSGTGSTGERISTNVLKFDKIDNDSDLVVSIHMPWYTPNGSSGFGLRLRTSVDGGSTVQNDFLADGPAHGWGSGGYGSVATSSIYNFTWNTESIISNTFVGEVRVYFEVKVWAASDSFYFGSYPGYSKHGFVHIEEVSRNHA